MRGFSGKQICMEDKVFRVFRFSCCLHEKFSKNGGNFSIVKIVKYAHRLVFLKKLILKIAKLCQLHI